MSSLHYKLLRRQHVKHLHQRKMSLPSNLVKLFLEYIEEHNNRFRFGELGTAIESIRTCGHWSDVSVSGHGISDEMTEIFFVPIISGCIQSIREVIPSSSDLRYAIDSYWMMLSQSIENECQSGPNSTESFAVSGPTPSPLENSMSSVSPVLSVAPVSSVSPVSPVTLDSRRHTPEGLGDNDQEIVNLLVPPSTPIPSNFPRRDYGDGQSESLS